MAITKNIVTDYGADNTGVADAAPAFYTGLKPDMAGEDCNLTIPAGTYKMASTPGGFFWASGMNSLNVTATGATINTGPVLGSFHVSQVGIAHASGKSARIKSVSAGATSVELTAASAAAGYISRAVVGQWMIVAGFDTQGLFGAAYGFPANPHFFDYVQITAVDTTNKIISFAPALSESYSDQWPELSDGGSGGEMDNGGPATVYFLHADWGCTKEFNGGTYTNANLIQCEGHTFTIRNGNHSGGGLPVYPTVNKNWSAIDHDVSGAGQMELDKLVENALFDGGASYQFHNQSSSLKYVTIRNTTMSGSINGTGRNGVVDNCVIGGNLNVGCDGYGRADTFVCRNTSVAGSISEISLREIGPDGAGVQDIWSMANGVITVPLTTNDSVGRIWPPDPYGRNVLFWQNGGGKVVGSFRVLSITSDSWPAVDDQTVTTNVTSTNTSNAISFSSSLFTAGDVGKVILIPGASGSPGSPLRLKTVIASVVDPQNITVFHAATRTQVAASQSVQWGTCNMYVQTNQSGGLPDAGLYPTGKLYCKVPAARTVSFENVTGSDTAVDLSQVAARNRPLWSYSKRTYDGATGIVSSEGPAVTLYGTIVALKFNVITPYTGAGTLSVGLSAADNLTAVIDGALTVFAPRVNLKIAGERVITVGSTTGTQALDANLTMSSPVWMTGPYRAGMSRNISGENSSLWPSFTIEFITDQGFYTGPVAVAPLRLRLRAA